MAARKKATRKKPARKKATAKGVSRRPSGPKGGQPKYEFDSEQLFRMIRRGNPIEGCADMLGVSRSTLHRHIAEDPELKAAVDKARAVRHDRLLAAMMTSAIRGSAPQQIFLAKNWCGLREIRAVELTGADGGPLEVNHDLRPVLEDKLDEFLRTRTNGGAD